MAEKAASEDDVHVLTPEEMVKTWMLPLTVAKRKAVAPVGKKYKRKSFVRVGTWNMLSFTKRKAMNPGIREVVCMTILENG